MRKDITGDKLSLIGYDSKTVSWLFNVGIGSGTSFFSTKATTIDGNSYVAKILPSSFDGIKMNRHPLENKRMSRNETRFAILDPNNLYTDDSFRDKNLTISVALTAQAKEEIIRSWTLKVTQAQKVEGRVDINAVDILSYYTFNKTYPNTPLTTRIDESDRENPITNGCVPVVFGKAYVPLRPVYNIDDEKRYYVIGESADDIQTIYEVATPVNWSHYAMWDNANTFNILTKTFHGIDYKVIEPLIADSDGDGTADAAGFFVQSGSFLEMPVKYSTSSSLTTAWSDIIRDILADCSIATGLIDYYATFASANETLMTRGFYGDSVGLYFVAARENIWTTILNSLDSYFTVADKIELNVRSYASLACLTTSEIFKTGNETTRTSFKKYYIERQIANGINLSIRKDINRPQTHLNSFIMGPGMATAATDLLTDIFNMPFANNATIARRSGSMIAQRIFWPKTRIEFEGRDSLLMYDPEDHVSIYDDDKYGGTIPVRIDSMHFKRNLRILVYATEFQNDLETYNWAYGADPVPGTYATDSETPITDDPWTPITTGPPASTPTEGIDPAEVVIGDDDAAIEYDSDGRLRITGVTTVTPGVDGDGWTTGFATGTVADLLDGTRDSGGITYIDCCIDGGYAVPTIVGGSTDDTIDNGVPATITIENGCAPYEWAVTGLGFTIDPDGDSDDLSATVSVTSGTCGVHFDAACTITVTDGCGNAVSHRLRHTDGSWESIAGFSRSSSCEHVTCCGAGACDGLAYTYVYHDYNSGAAGFCTSGVDAGCYARWRIHLATGSINPVACCDSDPDRCNHSLGGGSTCGADVILGAEYGGGVGTCDCDGQLHYWTCTGANCN